MTLQVKSTALYTGELVRPAICSYLSYFRQDKTALIRRMFTQAPFLSYSATVLNTRPLSGGFSIVCRRNKFHFVDVKSRHQVLHSIIFSFVVYMPNKRDSNMYSSNRRKSRKWVEMHNKRASVYKHWSSPVTVVLVYVSVCVYIWLLYILYIWPSKSSSLYCCIDITVLRLASHDS